MIDPSDIAHREAECILYAAPDGATKVRAPFKDETACLLQKAPRLY